MSNISPWADFSYDELNVSVEKDLKISYLEHYDLNNYHDFNKEQSKSALKDITDKYGFYWDDKGRLIKARPFYHANQVHELKKHEKNKLTMQKPTIVSEKKLSKNKNKQNINYKTKDIETSDCGPIKSEISSINNRINSIVNKYKPHQLHVLEEMDTELLTAQKIEPRVLGADGFKETVDKECYCKCQQKTRITAEDDNINSPYFGAQQRGYNKIVRSKSTNALRRIPHNLTSQKQEQSRVSLIQRKMDAQIEKFRERQKTQFQAELYNDKSQQNELDGKINQITLKIKEFQRQKEKLNLDFKRFQTKQLSKTPEKHQNHQSKSQQKPQKTTLQSQPSKISSCSPKPPQNNLSITNLPTLTIQNSILSIKTPKQASTPTMTPLNTTIQQQSKVKKIKNSIISKFCRQIQLDQQFRNAKLWFENNDDPHKWGIIADKLAVQGVVLKYHQLVEKFSCASQEHNPFFSVQNSHQSYSSLLAVYREHERYWKQEISCKFTQLDLQQQQFVQRQLDIEQKGYVKVQDLVRYINMRTKNFYRTRDLILIFNRFGGKQKKQVHFSRFLQLLLA